MMMHLHVVLVSIANPLGRTLLDFCWQGALVAVVVWSLLRLLAGRNARLRYAVAMMGLVAMILLPVATFVHRLGEATALRTLPLAGFSLTVSAFGAGEGSGLPWQGRLGAWLNDAAPYLPMLWLAGVAAFLLRLNLGLIVARRMRAAGQTIADADTHEIEQLFRTLEMRLGVRQAVRLIHSAAVQVPTVIGWLRPVVLLPVGCMASLSPMQIEALLAHELAHIRRHDYLVSVAQGAIEALLFYHPAVWWLSRQVRRERECCCDDIAVAVVGDALDYAKALAVLERRRTLLPDVALGANGGVLTMRIKRLLGVQESSAGAQVAALVVLAAVLLAGGIAAERIAHAQATPKISEATEVQLPAYSDDVDSKSATPQSTPAASVQPQDDAPPAMLPKQLDETKQSLLKPSQQINSPEFRKQIADAEASLTQVNTSELQKEVRESVQSAMKASAASRKLAATLNDPAFRREMAKAQIAIATVNSPRFKKQMEDAIRSAQQGSAESQKQLAEALNSPAFRSELANATSAIAKIDTPEFKKELEEAVRALEKANADQLRIQVKGLIAQSGVPAPITTASASAVPGSTTAPLQISGGVMASQTVSLVNPVYPPDAKAAGVQGAVVLHATISKTGTVQNLQVVSGPDVLRTSALDAVRQWTYKPYLLNGQPTDVETTVTVNYHLAGTGVASQESAAASGDTVVPRRIGDGVSAPVLIYSVDPEYTPEARAAKASGHVVLSLWVDEAGHTGHVRVVRGIEDGPGGTKIKSISQDVADGLDEKAMEAVRQYRFKPAMADGKPVLVQLNVEVNFMTF